MKATRRAKPAPAKTAPKSTRTLARGTAGRKSAPPARAVKSRKTAKAKPAPPRAPLPETLAKPPVGYAAAPVPAPVPVAASMLALESAPVPVPVRARRRRGPRIKFTRWLYSEELYRQLGVSPRGQALVCRELRAERDGSWSARVAAVPSGFFEATWVIVPPEVVVPVARPKRVDATH